MSNKTYDLLKLVGQIILPAVAAFYGTLAGIWGLPFAEQIPQTIMALVVLLNACLNHESSSYYKSQLNNQNDDKNNEPVATEVGEG